jgi:hypothetical protein
MHALKETVAESRVPVHLDYAASAKYRSEPLDTPTISVAVATFTFLPNLHFLLLNLSAPPEMNGQKSSKRHKRVIATNRE